MSSLDQWLHYYAKLPLVRSHYSFLGAIAIRQARNNSAFEGAISCTEGHGSEMELEKLGSRFHLLPGLSTVNNILLISSRVCEPPTRNILGCWVIAVSRQCDPGQSPPVVLFASLYQAVAEYSDSSCNATPFGICAFCVCRDKTRR